MWSSTVVVIFAFSFSPQAFGGDIPDVTTIYEIGHAKIKADDVPDGLPWDPTDSWENVGGEEETRSRVMPCINGVKGRIHARTNALGLGFVDEENEYFVSNIYKTPIITYDANFLNEEGYAQWDFKSEVRETFLDDSSAYFPIRNGVAYKIEESCVFRLKHKEPFSYLLFTRGSQILELEEIYFIVKFYGSHQEDPDIYYNCNGGETHYGGELYYVINRDGSPITVSCQSRYTSFPINYDDDYLTVNLSNGRKTLEIHRGMGDSATTEIIWNRETFENINYFSLTSDMMFKEPLSTSIPPKALEILNGVVSPIFTPQTNDLCFIIVYHSSISTLSSELEISLLGLVSDEIQLLDTVSNVKSGLNVKMVNTSLTNLNPIKIRIQKLGNAKISILRIASCNPDGEEVVELPSSISVCPEDRTHSWREGISPLRLHTATAELIDPVLTTVNSTNHCWNGGVLTTAGCACAPGFSGFSCETGCGRNRYGRDCEGLCSFHQEECRGLLLCNKFTGCKCAPGYYGYYCTKACPGRYGNDCSERCGHCAGNSTCDIYTGECTSCEDGYLAPHCQTASVYYGSKPEASSPTYGTLVVSFDPSSYVTQGEPPQLYQIQFREKGSNWKVHITKSLQKTSEEEEGKKISEKIEGLKSGFFYQVKVLLIDSYLFKYDGNLVQEAEVLIKCYIPSSYDYKVKASSNTTAVTFSWSYIREEHWCPSETFEVTWKSGWKKQIILTKENITVNDLVSGLDIEFKLRAKTSGGFAPYSTTLIISTKLSELPPVRNLRVESSQSTSVEVSWEPPRGSGGKQLRYTVTYKCVDRPACSPGCQNVSEGQLTQDDTSITLNPLLPFTKYLVTVSAEDGTKSSIYVGTTKVVPTEVPVMSLQKPVRTNTSVTVFWDQPPVCTGYLLGYTYQLVKASETLKILASGLTKATNASFHNLTASTEYEVRVFVSTIAGWNPLSYLTINISTSATVPESVRNLTVYKRGRGILGLRWAEPRATYGQLKSFTVTHSQGQESSSRTVEPTHCVVWPDLYCHTIEGLRSNRRYNITVSARNSEMAEDGQLMAVSAVTKESLPSPPQNLKFINSSSTSLELKWNYPEMPNGVVRSFLISVEETEKYDLDSCCQVYPLTEIIVKEELKNYTAEVSGLHPASTYFVSVSAKTVGLGPSQSLVVSTMPPHLPFTSLPRVEMSEVTWLPQENQPELNNSDVYMSLVRAHLLLAVLNKTQLVPLDMKSGVTDPKLDCLLQKKIGNPFYFIAEYNQDEEVELSGSLEDRDSTWGRPPASLPPVRVQLVATQVLEYNGVYNVDLRYSQFLTLPN